MNSEDTKANAKTGRNFMFIAWFLIFALLYFVFEDQLSHQSNPNQSLNTYSDMQANVVTLDANRMGHFVTPGQINGQPVVFMLDTGATQVAIPERLASKLNLPRGREYFVNTANGTTKAYATRIDQLDIGTIRLFNVEAGITRGFNSDQILLGMSALKKLEFTHSNQQLTLKQYR